MTTQESFNPYAAPEAHVADTLPAGELVLASRFSRLRASVIDGVLVGVPMWMVFYVLWGGTAGGIFGFAVSHPFLAPLVANTIGMVAQLLINGRLLQTQGQTWGKRMVGIRIVRTDGSRADLTRLFGLRFGAVYAAAVIPFIGSWIAFLDALFIFGKSRRCLHDLVAGTKVVRAV